jgi:hypothetical protein
MINNKNIFFLLKFLAGKNERELDNGKIEYVYYVPKTQRSHNYYHLDRYSENERIIVNNVAKLSNSRSSSHSNYHFEPEANWDYQEGSITEGSPCDKVCNGVRRIKITPVCLRGKKAVSDEICSLKMGKEAKWRSEPCNTDCYLTYELFFFF